MESKKYAKAATAFAMLEALINAGEVDSTFKPIIEEDDENEFEEVDGKKVLVGSKENEKWYACPHAQQFQFSATPGEYNLYVISLRFLDQSPYAEADTLFRHMCLAVKSELPPLPSFKIHPRFGEIQVHFEPKPIRVNFDQMDIDRLSRLSEIFYCNMLGIKCRTSDSSPNSVLPEFNTSSALWNAFFVPYDSVSNDLDRRSILKMSFFNWSSLFDVVSPAERNEYNHSEFLTLANNRNLLLIASYLYQQPNKPKYPIPAYRLITADTNVTIDHEMDSKLQNSFNKTFKDHYAAHGFDIIHPELRLLQVKDVSASRKRVSFVKASTRERGDAGLGTTIYFVPELVKSLPLDAKFWPYIMAMPTIIYRLDNLLKIDDFRRTIHSSIFNDSVNDSMGCAAVRSTYEPEMVVKLKVTPLQERLLKRPEPVANTTLEQDKRVSAATLGPFTPHFKELLGVVSNPTNVSTSTVCSNATTGCTTPDYIGLANSRRQSAQSDTLMKFDFELGAVDVCGENSQGPPHMQLVEAMTGKAADDYFNYERLEILGDSFLKFTTVEYLYVKEGEKNEGRLSGLKSRYVSNRFLLKKALEKNFQEIIIVKKFAPRRSWLPPGSVINVDLEAIELKLKNSTKLTKVEKKALWLQQHSVGDKFLSDIVESNIGVYTLTYGPIGGRRFMRWMDLHVLLQEEFVDKKPTNSFRSALNIEPSDAHRRTVKIYSDNNLKRLEQLIGYDFCEKSFLVQAVTHPSYLPNQVTDSYERLEFLGDAVLDYLITRILFDDKRKFHPGQITDLRSSLVNNRFFGSLTVEYALHDFLLRLTPVFDKSIRHLCENLTKQTAQDFIEETNCDVPKILGDIFESLVGAVYLDCHGSLNRVWQIFYPFLKPKFDEFLTNRPIHPVRALYEMFPQPRPKFGQPLKTNGTFSVTVTVRRDKELNKFDGIGKNSKSAKRNAAKEALAYFDGLEIGFGNI